MSDKIEPDKETAPQKFSLKKSLEKVPEKISDGIENGGGDEVITAVQDMLESVLAAPDKSCRAISQQIVLLEENSADAFVKRAYKYAAILAASVVLQMLLFEFTWKLMMRVIVLVLAAFIFDIIVRRNTRRDETKKGNRTNKKPDLESVSEDDIVI